MFLDWKNQYCEGDYTTQSNLHIQCNPYQITNGISTELEQKILQFVWEHKRLRTDKAILRKKNRAGGIRLPNFRLYYKATGFKTVRYWHKNKYTEQWNSMTRPEINSHRHGRFIYDKGGLNTQRRKDISSINGAGKTRQLHVKL